MAHFKALAVGESPARYVVSASFDDFIAQAADARPPGALAQASPRA
jgi:hypothetical protein